ATREARSISSRLVFMVHCSPVGLCPRTARSYALGGVVPADTRQVARPGPRSPRLSAWRVSPSGSGRRHGHAAILATRAPVVSVGGPVHCLGAAHGAIKPEIASRRLLQCGELACRCAIV